MRGVWIFLTGIGIVGAFLLGQMSSIADVNHTELEQKQSEISSAFDNFIEAQRETIDFFETQGFFDNEQNSAEAYRTLLWSVVGAIKMDGLHDSDYPKFMRWVDWSSKSGLDNPDNTYFFTQLRDDGEYMISGTRGTTTGLVFQLLIGQPGVGSAGTSTNVDIIYADDLIIDEGGKFEITVSRTKLANAQNWIELKDGAQTLIVRHTHSDWQTEQIGELNIVSLNSDLHSPPLTDEIMTARLNAIATAIRDRNKSWITLANTVWTRVPRNIMTPPRPTPGGLVGQYSAFATFELEDDDALVLTSYPSDMDYQGIQLGNRWFTSLDYETHTSSLTPAQSYRSSDGAYHYVISKRDPGIHNWLDPENHTQGLVMMRWQGKSQKPPKTANMKLVKFDQLKKYLPNDVPVFSDADRQNQIQARQMAVKKRFP